MPIKNGTIFCINHPDLPMVRNAGFNAITTFEKTSLGYTFNPATGMPVVVFFCDECGYIETYAAQKTSFWSEPEIQRHAAATRYSLFESAVFEALQRADSPFNADSIDFNVPLRSGIRQHEADAIVKTPNATFVIEIKLTPLRRTLEGAALNAKSIAKILSSKSNSDVPVVPIIVSLPSGDASDDVVLGVPVLKFNPSTRQFENAEILKSLY